MKIKYLSLIFILCLGLLAACGSDNDDDSNDRSPQEEVAEDFSTRLNDNLLVAGTKCNGSETVESNGQTFTCDRDEWLITIDNVNTCNDNVCTEAEVMPFIAELDLTDIISIPEYGFFEIDPDSPVTPAQQAVINDVYVRFNLNGDTDVVYRRDI